MSIRNLLVNNVLAIDLFFEDFDNFNEENGIV